jgi:hypothetical protein
MDKTSRVRRGITRTGVLSFLLLVSFSVSPAYPADKEDFRFRKEPELQQIRPKKAVKIKLKRTAKDEYSWELDGDDVDEIIKADRKLRQQLHLPAHAPVR